MYTRNLIIFALIAVISCVPMHLSQLNTARPYMPRRSPIVSAYHGNTVPSRARISDKSFKQILSSASIDEDFDYKSLVDIDENVYDRLLQNDFNAFLKVSDAQDTNEGYDILVAKMQQMNINEVAQVFSVLIENENHDALVYILSNLKMVQNVPDVVLLQNYHKLVLKITGNLEKLYEIVADEAVEGQHKVQNALFTFIGDYEI